MKNTQKGSVSVTGKGVGYFIPDQNPEETKTSKIINKIIKPIKKGEEIEIQPDRLHTACNNDEVEITLLKDKYNRREQGEVVSIIKRAKTAFVGTLSEEKVGNKTVLTLTADDRRMYRPIIVTVPDTQSNIADIIGLKAHVAITKWNEKGAHEGKLVKLLGKKGLHEVEMESIILERGFENDFPTEVLHEAERIEKTEKPIPAAEITKRRDFRQTLTFTIDPVDAKDFDDAISLKKIDTDLYEIGVHIADVSHYVREKTALDKEASKRAFSVYLVDRTIPMLPEVLSNDICSLNPNEDRLTFSAVFIINTKAEIKERWFGKTIIHSHKRFSYEEAQAILDAKTGTHYEELATLNTIAKQLAEHKFSAGAIDFEKDEVKFKLDENGKPLAVYKKARLETHRLVEDYMLLANREVAEYIHQENKKKHKKEGAFIYRIHDEPNPEKIADLSIFIRALGFDLEAHEGKVTSRAIRALLEQVTGTPQEALIKTATIRSMAKAIYSTANVGHFGLAFKYYTHFTSPIRRYPDLLVHRVLHAYLENKFIPDHEMAYYHRMADKSTDREIQAAEAERASIKYKQVEYMAERIGQTFTGTISGVSEWGIYVEENETRCEGMIKIRDIGDDFYIHDEKKYALVGEKNKRTFSLGDTIQFKVLNANLEKKTLDYGLVRG